MSAPFWFFAGLLAGVTATSIAVPLRRGVGRVGARPLIYIGGGIAVFTAVAAGLYLALGSLQQKPDSAHAHPEANVSTPGGTALSMEEATAQLEARLDRDGGSPNDWQLLAQSYEFLGRKDDAKRAREHVRTAGEAAGAIDKTPALATTEQAGPVGISGTVAVEASLAARVPRGATLFIYAKEADSPGPPLAVMRTTADAWPVSFQLDDSMAMMPSRRLSQFQKVVVEARISRSGQATPKAGDLYVTSGVLSPSARKKVTLIIRNEIG